MKSFGTFLSLLFILLSLKTASSKKEKDCPHRCICKWRDGKQTVDCFNASLGAVPSMNSETQVLNLNQNYLPVLRTEIFMTLKLVNLQKIYLSQCFIREIQEHSFRGLTNLVELDLSRNVLTTIPPLDDAVNLMRLSLEGNPIRRIRSSAFGSLKDLNTLELNDCGLEVIDKHAFVGLSQLQYLKLHSNKLQHFIPSFESFPQNLTDLTLEGNAWLCDCQLLELHRWLRNFSVPYSVEPRCASPSRVASLEIRTLDRKEFACIPEISPSSTYREVIEGKNISLDCLIRAIPEAEVFWYYKDTLIQNGSTLVSDIDLRGYYHLEKRESPEIVKSRLFLSSTSVDDNGTFACVAKNNAGRARAEFFLHVVVPMPPKPPQDVVEDRFRMEYLIAIIVAASLLMVISAVIIGLFALRCKRGREKRRKNFVTSSEETSLQSRKINSNSSPSAGRIQSSAFAGPEFGSTDTLSTQMTATPSMPSTTTTTHSALVVHHSTSVDDNLCTSMTYHSTTKREVVSHDLNFPPPPLLGSKEESIREEDEEEEDEEEEEYHETLCFETPKQGYHGGSHNRLSPPTPFADDKDKKDFLKSNTLTRRPHRSRRTKEDRRHCLTLPRKISSDKSFGDSDLVLPPPPQYKGVHFAPNIEKMSIPMEGLPKGPALPPHMGEKKLSPPRKKRKPAPPVRKGSTLSGSTVFYKSKQESDEEDEEEDEDGRTNEEKSLLSDS